MKVFTFSVACVMYMSWYSEAFTAPLFSVISFLYHSKSSVIHSHWRNQYDFLLLQDAQIYNTFSVWDPVLTVMNSSLLQTGCCSWHLFSAVVGSWIFSNIRMLRYPSQSVQQQMLHSGFSHSSCNLIVKFVVFGADNFLQIRFWGIFVYHNYHNYKNFYSKFYAFLVHLL